MRQNLKISESVDVTSAETFMGFASIGSKIAALLMRDKKRSLLTQQEAIFLDSLQTYTNTLSDFPDIKVPFFENFLAELHENEYMIEAIEQNDSLMQELYTFVDITARYSTEKDIDHIIRAIDSYPESELLSDIKMSLYSRKEGESLRLISSEALQPGPRWIQSK